MKKAAVVAAVRDAFYKQLEAIGRRLPPWTHTRLEVVAPPLLQLKVQQPLNLASLPASFAGHFIAVKHVPERRIFKLQGVWVSSEAVVFKWGKIFVPSLCSPEALPRHQRGQLMAQQWLSPVSPLSSGLPPAALVHDEWSARNYYHWMIEALPRLLLVLQTHPESALLVPDPAPAFVHRSLELLGVRNWHPLPRNTSNAMHVGRLLLPELVYYYEEHENARLSQLARLAEQQRPATAPAPLQEELIVAVRRQLLARHSPPARPWRRIYASRAGQKTRRLVNEAALLPLLRQWGFEVVCFEQLSFDQQLQLMQESELLLGLHGANLVNMLFLPQGARVLEMMNQQHFNEAYYLLASSLGLPYYAIPCQMVAEATEAATSRARLNDADVAVDLQLIEKTLQECLGPVPHQSPHTGGTTLSGSPAGGGSAPEGGLPQG
ncbi:glycosyltransferase family 61 protein [Cesiribacter andamanensis]|uniref:Capsular polysaccharide biosynthesis protein n=1 Tax=Cesiribacter andamanensis AMV16 TaxID=1279009 RepID=M7MWR8_9BACT|nr:glycosyltransferase family 61 protein [Cesiribacter andamanensis]EMR00858.1 Capsular polysaccharide biosynthesis protein [Cesiribacter andamanensis AMV16]